MTTADFHHQFVPAQRPDITTTLLLLHGTGGDETSLLGLGQTILPGAALLSPRGRVLEQGMPRYFRRLAMGVFDIPDLIARTHELSDFVASAADSYQLDPRHIVAVGYSNGANIAASVLLLRPETLAGAVLLRPMVPLVPEQTPNLAGRPVFVAAGERDSMVPRDQTEQLVDLLRRAGAAVKVRWEPGGHDLVEEEIVAARDWLRDTIAG